MMLRKLVIFVVLTVPFCAYVYVSPIGSANAIVLGMILGVAAWCIGDYWDEWSGH